MKQLEVYGLTKDYGNHRGVFDVSFAVEKGEIFGFLGPNGAGKTTTIRQLMGFIHPDSGTATVRGMDCFQNRDKIQKLLGYLPGEITLMNNMTGRGYLNFMAEMKGIRDKSRMQELIAYFDLDPSGSIRKMSKGTKQKLAIVATFMQNPEILILDEPTSGLDPLMQNRFVSLLLEEKKKGTTVLISSHIFEEVEKTCDRTAIIRDGELVTIENMSSMAQKKKKIYTITFADASSASLFAADHTLPIQTVHDNCVQLIVKGKPGKMLQRIALADPVDVDIKTQSLEELFLHFYSEEERT